jgi:lysophospholipase L1-like esterase
VKRIRRLGTDALQALLATLVLITLLEVCTRLALDAPRGIFSGFLPGASGLYPPNAEIEMVWGPIPYRISTNSLGFRGPELSPVRPHGKLRIAAIGDSVTDGFFVDDDATYPHLLERALAARGVRSEVINAARGSASLPKELAILREAVLPLAPDVVLLTFVTNDVAELRGVSREGLLAARLPRGRVPLRLRLITATALGELGYDLYLRVASEPYRRKRGAEARGAERYAIEGGASFERNVRIFLERYADTDSIALRERFTRKTAALIESYLFALDRFLAICAEHGIEPGLVYFPAYPEVYAPERSQRLRDLLARAAEERDLPFLDLTAAFRSAGRTRVLHLAPLDFHPNPEGNAVTAAAAADFVVGTLLPRVGRDGS